MRVHIITHVPFEGPANIENYFTEKGAEITRTSAYAGDSFPSVSDYDFLVVMGGPMGVGDEDDYSWMPAEKAFIREAVQSGKSAIGVCLGAQFLAESLGAAVTKMPQKEIGWFEIDPVNVIKEKQTVVHWHGETFSLPKGAETIAKSAICDNQGFVFDNRILALQFHIEMTPDSVAAIIEHGADELTGGPYIQSAEEMLAEKRYYGDNKKLLWHLLDYLIEAMEDVHG